MDEDSFSILDVESAILSGKIIERQQDQQTGEWKYIVEGKSGDGRTIVVVMKLGQLGNGVIITVFDYE